MLVCCTLVSQVKYCCVCLLYTHLPNWAVWHLPGAFRGGGWYGFFAKFAAKVAATMSPSPVSVGLGSAACVVFCRRCWIAGLSPPEGRLAPADPPCSPPMYSPSNIMPKSAPPAPGGGRSVSRASRPLGAAAGASPKMYRFGQVSLSFRISFNSFIYISNYTRLRSTILRTRHPRQKLDRL